MPQSALAVILTISVLFAVFSLCLWKLGMGSEKKVGRGFFIATTIVAVCSVAWLTISFHYLETDSWVVPVQTITDENANKIQVVCVDGTTLNVNKMCEKIFSPNEKVKVSRDKDYSCGINYTTNKSHYWIEDIKENNNVEAK